MYDVKCEPNAFGGTTVANQTNRPNRSRTAAPRYHQTLGYMRVCRDKMCHLFFRGVSSNEEGRRKDVSSDDSMRQKFNPQSTCTSQTQLKIEEPKNKILHLDLNFSVPFTTVVIVTIKLQKYLNAFHKWTHLLCPSPTSTYFRRHCANLNQIGKKQTAGARTCLYQKACVVFCNSSKFFLSDSDRRKAPLKKK